MPSTVRPPGDTWSPELWGAANRPAGHATVVGPVLEAGTTAQTAVAPPVLARNSRNHRTHTVAVDPAYTHWYRYTSVTRMRSFTNHVLNVLGIDTAVPVPVDITTFGPPGQNVCQLKLAWVGPGTESALPGHDPSGTLLMSIRAVRPPVVVIDTVGLPVTVGFV